MARYGVRHTSSAQPNGELRFENFNPSHPPPHRAPALPLAPHLLAIGASPCDIAYC